MAKYTYLDRQTDRQTDRQIYNSCFLLNYQRSFSIFLEFSIMPGRYIMKSNPHGKCLIINNHFGRDHRRHGTDKDCSRLNVLFRTLNYEVSIKEDLNGFEMFNILKDMSMDKENERYDSFACCILSHGNLNGVCGNDGESCLFYTQIWSLFGQNESTLRHKPKIFVIQACQDGVNQKTGIIETFSLGNLSTDDNDDRSWDDFDMGDPVAVNFNVEFDQGVETNHADMMIIKSSVPGKLFSFVILIFVKKIRQLLCRMNT